MGNIIDDIRANEDTFADRPFNEVDSLALAQLSYARMPVNVPRLDAEATDVDLAMVGVRDLLRAECYDNMFYGRGSRDWRYCWVLAWFRRVCAVVRRVVGDVRR